MNRQLIPTQRRAELKFLKVVLIASVPLLTSHSCRQDNSSVLLDLSAAARRDNAVSDSSVLASSVIGAAVPDVISTFTGVRSRFGSDGDPCRAFIVPRSMVTWINGEESSAACADNALATSDSANTVTLSRGQFGVLWNCLNKRRCLINVDLLLLNRLCSGGERKSWSWGDVCVLRTPDRGLKPKLS